MYVTPPTRVNPQIKKYLKKFRAAANLGQVSAMRLYLQGIRGDSGMWPGCGAGAAGGATGARRAEFTPVKWANAAAVGMVILAIWPVAKSTIEARPRTDSAGKCLPGIKLFGQRVADFTGWLVGLSCLCVVIPALREWLI